MSAGDEELPADLSAYALDGWLTPTEMNGSRKFHVSKSKRAFFALGRRREDVHTLYASAAAADVFTDPVDIFVLTRDVRVCQLGDAEFSLVFPLFCLTLSTGDRAAMVKWISVLNAVIAIVPLVERQPLHAFRRVHFPKFTWCQVCKEFIWGLGYQGYLCDVPGCQRAVHPKCLASCPADCSRS